MMTPELRHIQGGVWTNEAVPLVRCRHVVTLAVVAMLVNTGVFTGGAAAEQTFAPIGGGAPQTVLVPAPTIGGAPTVGGSAPNLNQPPAPSPGSSGSVPAAVGPASDADAALGLTTTDRAMKRLFDSVLSEGRGSLTLDQHRQVLEESEALSRARTRDAPGFRNAQKIVPLDSGTTIPVVNLDIGQVASIAFLDVTGEPWPIVECQGSAEFEGIKPAEGSHVLLIRAKSLSQHGSLVCVLKGLTTPARLRLETGTGEHDLGFDAVIPKLGPNAHAPPYEIASGTLVAGDDVLSTFLYGIPPQGAVAVTVAGGGSSTKAWQFHGEIYLRTPFVLLSPGPRAEARREGVHVYRIAPVPVLLMDDDGRDIEIRMAGTRVVRATVPPMGDGVPNRRPPIIDIRRD